MEPEGSLPQSQVPAICPYPERHHSSPFTPPPNLTSWRYILISSHLRLVFPSGFFPSSFSTKTLYRPHLSILHKSSIPYKNSQLHKVHDTLNRDNVVRFWFILLRCRNCRGYVPSHVMITNNKWRRVCKESIVTCCNVLSRHLSGQTLKQATKSSPPGP
jgi:hypothetical protein